MMPSLSALHLLTGATIRSWSADAGLGLLVQGLFPCEVIESPGTLVLRFLRLSPISSGVPGARVIEVPDIEVRYSTAFELPRSQPVVGHARSGEEALDRTRAFITAHGRLAEVFTDLLHGLLLRQQTEAVPDMALLCRPVPKGLSLQHPNGGPKLLVDHPAVVQSYAYLTQVTTRIWVPNKAGRGLHVGQSQISQHARLDLIAGVERRIQVLHTEVLPVLHPDAS